MGIPVTLIESRTKFFGDLEARRILRSLGKGEIDAAFLRAGLAEDTERANGRRILDGFTVMRPKKDALRAVHSSEVFPAPTLISGTAIPSETQHRILTTLLTMPPDGYGAQWTIPAQSTAVNRLTRDLEIEPYEYLRHWTLSRIWKEYRAGVLLAAVILFSMLCHGWLLEKLVRTRTAQLRKALADQLAAEKLAALKSEELKRTERKAVVAQLSSIFAHEISSPLSALQNLVRGVRLSIDRRLESEKELESEDLEAVDDQLSDVESQIGKVSAIVSKVRNYARGVSLRKPFRLDKLLSEVADLASKRSVHAVAVTVRNRAGAVAFTGDALEFELIILNLVKNAIEAAESVPSPAVLCTLSRNADEIVLEIADNGPALTEEAWSNLNSRNRTSSKSKGLGLGLGIVTALVEKYGGSLSFHRLDEGGTAARVRLPYTP